MSPVVPPTFVPRPPRGIDSAVVDGEKVLWHGGRVHRLDAIGARVWEQFDGVVSVATVSQQLAEQFGADPAAVERDVAALCADLIAEGLLADERGSYAPAPPSSPRAPGPRTGPGQPAPAGVAVTDVDFAHTSGRFVALDHDFGVRTTDVAIGEYFDHKLRAFGRSGEPASMYSVIDSGEEGPTRFAIYLDDLGLVAVPDADVVVRYLLWHVNNEAVRRADRHYLVHAAGAEIDGQALAFPGSMNAGKTTLVAGLVLDGFRFLTDELVALNLESGIIDPYPRPLNVGRGAWPVLAVLEPADWNPEAPLPRDLWHIDATSIRPGAVAEAAPLRFVIAPRFEAGAATTLEPVSRGEGAELLVTNAMNRRAHGKRGFRAVAAAVAEARCARLVSGDLAQAVAAVRDYVARAAR